MESSSIGNPRDFVLAQCRALATCAVGEMYVKKCACVFIV